MRFDKLTTKFQQAFADAQSLALGHDNGFIEPQHLLAALLAQEDGGTTSLLARAGVQVPKLQAALKASIDRLPKVEGQGGEITVSRDLNNLLNLTDKEATKRGDQFIASELFLLALTGDKGDTGRIAKEAGLNRKALEAAIETVRGGAGVSSQEAEGQREALTKYTIDLTARAREGKLDPVIGRDDEIRRTIQILQRRTKNNPGADRRARRGQDGDRRGPGAAHRQRRSAGDAQEQARAVARHGGTSRGHQISRRVRGAAEGRAEGHRGGRGPDDRLHRRTAHDGRRRQGRGRDGRRQHAEARARARRTALRRRDHARRIPQVCREGRRARAPLPEGDGRRAVGGEHHRHPPRTAGALRDPSRRRHHRPGDRRRGGALAPLHHRPLSAGQGHRPDRRGRRAHPHGDRLQAGGDGQARPPADPAQDRTRGSQEGKGRSVEEAPRAHRRGDQEAGAGIRGLRRGVAGREGAGRRLAAHQGGDRQDQARDGRGQAQGRLAEDVRAAVRQAAAARGAAEEGGHGVAQRGGEGAQAACARRSARKRSPKSCRAPPAFRCRR